MTQIDEFIVTEDNQELYDRVMGVTQAQEAVRMFVYGPSSSGKTKLVYARGREKDLLSTKSVMFCHADELLSFFNLDEVGESFLDRVGKVDILLLDGFERFFKGEAIARELCRLLLEERSRLGLSTIVFSGAPYGDLEVAGLGFTLEGFERWELAPLRDDGERLEARER